MKYIACIFLLLTIYGCKTAQVIQSTEKGFYVGTCKDCNGASTFLELYADGSFRQTETINNDIPKITKGSYKAGKDKINLTYFDQNIGDYEFRDNQITLPNGRVLNKVNSNIYKKKWKLTEINDKKIKDDYYLDIEPNSNRFLAYAGCNKMRGEVRVEPTKMFFSKVVNTKISCKDVSAELAMLQLFQYTTEYKIIGNTLIFINTAGKIAAKFDFSEKLAHTAPAPTKKYTMIWINSRKVDCKTGPCFEYQTLEKIIPQAWQPLSKDIVGFDFQPGFVYRIEVSGTAESGFEWNRNISKVKVSQPKTISIISTWKLKSIKGETPNSPRIPFLEITGDKFSGFDGCNDFSGTIAKNEGDELQFDHIVNSKEMCPNDNVSLLFLPFIKKTASYNVEGQELILLDANHRETLRFVKSN